MDCFPVSYMSPKRFRKRANWAESDGPGLQPSELVRPEAQADGLGWYAAGLWPWVGDGAKEKQITVRE